MNDPRPQDTPAPREPVRPMEGRLREVIRAEGPIPFARFMALALYAPQGGYYRGAGPISPIGGDYYTSPTAHPLFGALLAAQLSQMWEQLGRPAPFTVLEPGAGSGVMARDIIEAARADFPAFADALRYVTLDYAAPPAADALSGVESVLADGLPARGVVGCILANELLDALPVHRYVVHGGVLREVYVGVDKDGGFREVLGGPSSEAVAAALARLAPLAPEGHRGEVSIAAAEWVTEAAAALERGYLLLIDYGGVTEQLLAPERGGGTLRCHYRHVVTGNPYVRIGAQDITAHVDFTRVREAGEAAGLTPLGYADQGDFLRNLGADAYLQALSMQERQARGPAPSTFRDGALPRQDAPAAGMAMRALLDPSGLGGFRVLAMGVGAPLDPLWGFAPDNPRRAALLRDPAALRLPRLSRDHMPLLAGAYPHAVAAQGWRLGDPPPLV